MNGIETKRTNHGRVATATVLARKLFAKGGVLGVGSPVFLTQVSTNCFKLHRGKIGESRRESRLREIVIVREAKRLLT